MSYKQIDILFGYQLIIVAVFVKYVARVVFTKSFPQSCPPTELRERMFFLLEHILFSLFGYYSVIHVPGHSSWYFHPKECWVYPPIFPSQSFHLFYIAKLGTHFEDVLFRVGQMLHKKETQLVSKGSNMRNANGDGELAASGRADVMMDIHHIAAASLCILSYYSGYHRIGSLLMLIHDISDVPLDMLRVFMALDWEIPMYCSYVATILAWSYLRVWVLGGVILRTVVMDTTTSFIFPCQNAIHNPDCVFAFYAEMSVYVVLIGALWVLHVLWFRKMVLKGYRLFAGNS